METFQADWLTLRRPYDETARSKALAQQFLAALPAEAVIADLAAGKGHNAKYLNGLAERSLNWRLLDADAQLLALAQQNGFSGIVKTDLRDFSTQHLYTAAQGITASAFFDLVSHAWLTEFIGHMPRVPLLFALTANGVWDWSPDHPDDTAIMAAFEKDHKKIKDFGPALGSTAATALPGLLSAAGFSVACETADWELGAADGNMLSVLVTAMANIAEKSLTSERAVRWRDDRRRQIAQGTLGLRVGHVDVLALPSVQAAS